MLTPSLPLHHMYHNSIINYFSLAVFPLVFLARSSSINSYQHIYTHSRISQILFACAPTISISSSTIGSWIGLNQFLIGYGQKCLPQFESVLCDLTRAQNSVFFGFGFCVCFLCHTLQKVRYCDNTRAHTCNVRYTLRDTHLNEHTFSLFRLFSIPTEKKTTLKKKENIGGRQKSGNDNENNEVIVMKMPRHLWRKRSRRSHKHNRMHIYTSMTHFHAQGIRWKCKTLARFHLTEMLAIVRYGPSKNLKCTFFGN